MVDDYLEYHRKLGNDTSDFMLDPFKSIHLALSDLKTYGVLAYRGLIIPSYLYSSIKLE